MQNNQKIPEGWSVKKLKEVAQVITGSTPPTSDINNYGNDYLFVSPVDINSNIKYIIQTNTKLSLKGFNQCRVIRSGSPLFVCIGSTIGKIAIAGTDLVTNQQINSCVIKNGFNNEFLYYQLSSQAQKIRLLAGEQAVPIINKSTFEKIKLLFPPLPEQEKIAEILGTWDEAIEKLSNLIEQKKLLKKGLMQKLLTGKTRLPGFTQPWKEVKLGEICNITTGKLDANAMVENGQYKFFTCAKETYLIDNYAFNTEALLISGNGANVGYIHYYKGKFNAYQRTYVLDKFTLNIFLVKYLLDQFLSNRIEKEKKAGNTPYIVLDTLAKMKLYLPIDISEQQAIADVLSTADDEINLLNQKLEALKEQKKGLMQQLLTGQIRVKVN